MTKDTTMPSDEELTEDRFYGQLDNIIMWCFTLGFNAARREYGEQYKSAQEAEPFYEDNLDSWVQDIVTSHEELLAKTLHGAQVRGRIEGIKLVDKALLDNVTGSYPTAVVRNIIKMLVCEETPPKDRHVTLTTEKEKK